MNNPNGRNACELAAQIADGTINSSQVTAACLSQIEAREAQVQAFQYIDPQYVSEQARARDEHRKNGSPLGALHGVPVAIKDIFDTIDMPTENGTAVHLGRQPAQDCAPVARLRAAGAVIVGKTVTTEMAYFSPGKTTNPHDAGRTPGGSSSGSAAAVAASMVPLALGSQTNGSVLRPASFCGVYGFKPSHGLISRAGVLMLSRSLDHVGVFARSLQDIALATDVIAGQDSADPDTRTTGMSRLQHSLMQTAPTPLRIGFVRTPWWNLAEPSMVSELEALAAQLGERCLTVELPTWAAQVPDWQRTVMCTEMAHNFRDEYEHGRDKLSAVMIENLERGRQVTAFDYQQAKDDGLRLRGALDELLRDFDALMMPASPGAAPAGLATTGNPVFNSMASLSGNPAISLPLLVSEDKLPMGVQLVGRFGDDGRLLRTARALEKRLGAA